MIRIFTFLVFITHIRPFEESKRCRSFFLALLALHEHTMITAMDTQDKSTKQPLAISMIYKRSKFEDPVSEFVIIPLDDSVESGEALSVPAVQICRNLIACAYSYVSDIQKLVIIIQGEL